jgi:hypothetical protein
MSRMGRVPICATQQIAAPLARDDPQVNQFYRQAAGHNDALQHFGIRSSRCFDKKICGSRHGS